MMGTAPRPLTPCAPGTAASSEPTLKILTVAHARSFAAMDFASVILILSF